MSDVHVCVSPIVGARIIRGVCPTCEKRRYLTVFSYEWYGPSVTCLWCGEHWEDGERMERPFMRGWRKKSVENAKRRYRRVRGTAWTPPVEV